MSARLEQKLIKTAAFQTAYSAIDRCVREQILSIVIAPPGVGKSHAIGVWRARHANVRHVAIEATLRQTAGPALYALAGALSLQISHGRIDRLSVAIAESLARNPRLVIFDEADMFTLSAFEKIRGIWDLVSKLREEDGDRAFPCIMFGTAKLRELLSRPDLERLHRRVGELDELPRLTVEEVELVLRQKWPQVKLDDGAVQDLHLHARGSFGWLNRIVPLAAELAAKDGQVVTPEIVRASLRYLFGGRGGR